MKLVIVESPAKCGKIQGYLGADYRVVATMGHIRALDETLESVGIDRGWEPIYKELGTKKDAIVRLKSAAKGVDQVILATDDDREGEGIAWHVCFLLKLNPTTTPRIVFHEITEPAIRAAVAAPRLLDLHKVNAQQARSMLDLLVGFTISRVLWTRVAPKLSAGRCQTPALRLVAERDRLVDNHTASAFWRLVGSFAMGGCLSATAVQDVATEEEATAALNTVKNAPAATILSVKESVSVSNPPKPLITSTLQQEASSIHGLAPKSTMMAAQKLYEAGHITYMRTDQAVLSEEAKTAIRAWVTTNHGASYLGVVTATPAVKAVVKAVAQAVAQAVAAQAAHEAIRPTHPERRTIDVEDRTQTLVYNLIWRRATQSQMAPCLADVRKVTLSIDADPTRIYSTEQTKSKFLGWRVLEPQDADKTHKDETEWSTWAPLLAVGAKLAWSALNADQHFTKPKGRFTEASLIQELEHAGIGRPSTFASLVGTIVERDYVEKTNVEGTVQESRHLTLHPREWPPTVTTESHKVGAEKNKLRTTALGRSVIDFLSREYDDLFAYGFTARMEQELDEVAHGTKPWKSVLQTTWDAYKTRYLSHTEGATRTARERVLGPGLKVIQSKKGPLYVREPADPKGKAAFASLGSDETYDTATLEQAEAAFASVATSRAGTLVGLHSGHEVRKKSGPYGLYVEWNGVRASITATMTFEEIVAALQAKAGVEAFHKVVGIYTVKRGPYGLYFYKTDLKKPRFVSLPTGASPDTLTSGDLTALYSAKKGVKN
jgi:DNA topoisomerase-1